MSLNINEEKITAVIEAVEKEAQECIDGYEFDEEFKCYEMDEDTTVNTLFAEIDAKLRMLTHMGFEPKFPETWQELLSAYNEYYGGF